MQFGQKSPPSIKPPKLLHGTYQKTLSKKMNIFIFFSAKIFADNLSPREIITAVRNGKPRDSWLSPGTTRSERNLTHWTNCDRDGLTYPYDGEVLCRDNRCVVKCDPGYFPDQRNMQAFCRHTKKKGHFWNRDLPTCVTCSPKTIEENSRNG